MDTKKSLIWIGIICLCLVVSCSSNSSREETILSDSNASAPDAETLPGTTFSFVEESKEFPDAILEMYAPLSNQTFSPGRIPFEFNIKNYPFGEEPGHPKLYLITNGDDPIGHQSPIFQLDLKEGTYRTVAYLVDTRGLALKEFGNYVDRDFLVGNSRPFPYSAEPYVVVNLPRHLQAYPEGEAVIVDFLVIGGDMLLDQLEVRIRVGDEEFVSSDVMPVTVANLPKGEHQIHVELRRQNGKDLDGPFSSAQKTILIQ